MNDDRNEVVQVAVVQLDDYGPWTVSLEPRREADLQSMQAWLFADVSGFFGSREGYVFAPQYDDVVAVTNGVSRDDHRREVLAEPEKVGS